MGVKWYSAFPSDNVDQNRLVPFEYLTKVLTHPNSVNPKDLMPWCT